MATVHIHNNNSATDHFVIKIEFWPFDEFENGFMRIRLKVTAQDIWENIFFLIVRKTEISNNLSLV